MSDADAAGGIADSLEANLNNVAPDVNRELRTRMKGRVFGWLDIAHGSAERQLGLGQKHEKDGKTLKMATEKKIDKADDFFIRVKGEVGEEEGDRRQDTSKQQRDNSSRKMIEAEKRHQQQQRQVQTKERGHQKENDQKEHEECIMLESGQEKQESGGESDDLPEIVRIRRRNIARNQAMMAALSLPQSRPQKRRRKQETDDALTPAVAVRRSKRLLGDKVDYDGLPARNKSIWVGYLQNTESGSDDAAAVSRIKYDGELDSEQATQKLMELDKKIRERDEAKAGSASYQHCLNRVTTMGDAQLARRVRAIEREHGKKAEEKMLVFVNVLRDRGKREVLALAEAALDRLLRGIPMPEKV